MDIIKSFRSSGDLDRSVQMEAYMKNQFPFLGLPRPVRDSLQKEVLKEKVREKGIDWDWIMNVYELPEREFQYLAIDYLRKCERRLLAGDLEKVEKLIRTKSWWDTVDALAMVVGAIVRNHADLKNRSIRFWIADEDFWIRRVSILFQLKYKGDTDTQFLESAILNNTGSNEFFINKAIGWALREYSKTNPAWVKKFLATHTLSGLSIREASKYL